MLVPLPLFFPMKLPVVCIQMSDNNKRLVLSTTRKEVSWEREPK